MTDSLRDQLLGLGFKAPAPDRQARRPGRDERRAPGQGPRKSAARSGNPGTRPPGRRTSASPAGQQKRSAAPQGDIDLAKAFAIRAQREKEERIEAERRKQEEARLRREARAKLETFVGGKSLNKPEAEIARHFEYGGKIKRIHVDEAQLKALNAGELGVVQLNGRYLLVTAAVLDEAEAIFAPSVALRVDPSAPPADDPYSDPKYQVPDDLVW